MKSNLKVSGIVIFGLLVSFLLPSIITLTTTKSLDKDVKTNNTKTQTKNDMVVMNTKKDTAVPVMQEVSSKVQEEVQEQPKQEQVVKAPSDPVVFDGLTLNQLGEKLNRSLKSNLEGTGPSFAKYAVEMGIDPYLAVAIVLHETGCFSGSCSNQVRTCNNVGGMKGSPGCGGTSYKYFESLDAGIYSFMLNLKTNYYDKGLTTAEAMNSKYAASTSWAQRVNSFAEKIKAA